MKKLNEYLVGGWGRPMKLVHAASEAEAVKAWRKKTGIEDGEAPSVSTVLERGKKTVKKATPKKAGGKAGKTSAGEASRGEQEVEA